MSPSPFPAVILDLDGVITQTVHLHARAWAEMFDDYLNKRSEQTGVHHEPFDKDHEYKEYVDGKPRYDGVESFLHARGIELPRGTPEDPPDRETICGLGNRKNALFNELLETHGAEAFPDAVTQIQAWRQQGIKTAVVSSSRNCVPILESLDMMPLFDAKVDGVDSDRLGLKGKPAPDIFLKAAEQLGYPPEQAMVVEDAVAGVEAGRAGHFGLVVGVARDENESLLRDHGAHIVVSELIQIEPALDKGEGLPTSRIPSVFERFDEITEALASHSRLALFIDYDGTLTPIVERPEDAVLSDRMRTLLRQLAEKTTIAIVSGRDRLDVQDKVHLDQLYFAGSHGFDIAGPGDLHMQHEDARDILQDLDEAERTLTDQLSAYPGVQVERKRYAIAIHFRRADPAAVPDVETIVDQATAAHERLRKRSGKKIFELQPDIAWDKGRAVEWLMQRLGLDSTDTLPMYLGDDTTDEDAFQALQNHGLTIRVGEADHLTHARYMVQDTDEVARFFEALLTHLEPSL